MQILLALIISAFLFSASAMAMTMDLGVNANQNSMIISDSDLNDVAEISTDLTFSPAIIIKSDYNRFQESNWGYFFEYSASTFHLNKQGDPNPVDIGTSISGTYMHFTPTLFYGFDTLGNIQTQTGIGVGVGYLDLQGNFLTDKTSNPTIQQVSGSGIGFSVGVYLEASMDHWTSRIHGYGPVVDIGPYTYQYIDVTISLSYRFDFDSQ